MKSNLVERVESALKNPNHIPWFPEFTTDLVEAGWLDLYNEVGLSPETYGTARAIARDASAPRRIVAWLPMISGEESPKRMLQVETLDLEFTQSYKEAGVRFYSAEEINAAHVLERLKEAITVLKSIPTLFATVAALLRSIHVLDPGDDDYDVSFSEPHIPFSIFISVPQAINIINAMRVTEAIVHEAMHLQLTLVERVVALAKSDDRKYFSPWRSEYRTARGLLHAIYVFRVIDCFFDGLLNSHSVSSRGYKYLRARRYEIAGQLNAVREFAGCRDLTTTGKSFVQQLLRISS